MKTTGRLRLFVTKVGVTGWESVWNVALIPIAINQIARLPKGRYKRGSDGMNVQQFECRLPTSYKAITLAHYEECGEI